MKFFNGIKGEVVDFTSERSESGVVQFVTDNSKPPYTFVERRGSILEHIDGDAILFLTPSMKPTTLMTRIGKKYSDKVKVVV